MTELLPSSLLFKRDFDFQYLTNNIATIVEKELITAAKLFLNKNRVMTVKSIDLKPETLPGYAFVQLYIKPKVGDTVQLHNGQALIDESNVDIFIETVNFLISLKALDSKSAMIMYKNITDVKQIVTNNKENSIELLLKFNEIEITPPPPELINSVEVQLLNNPDFVDLLEALTKPEEVSIMGFDKNRLTLSQIRLLEIRALMDNKGLIS